MSPPPPSGSMSRRGMKESSWKIALYAIWISSTRWIYQRSPFWDVGNAHGATVISGWGMKGPSRLIIPYGVLIFSTRRIYRRNRFCDRGNAHGATVILRSPTTLLCRYERPFCVLSHPHLVPVQIIWVCPYNHVLSQNEGWRRRLGWSFFTASWSPPRAESTGEMGFAIWVIPMELRWFCDGVCRRHLGWSFFTAFWSSRHADSTGETGFAIWAMPMEQRWFF